MSTSVLAADGRRLNGLEEEKTISSMAALAATLSHQRQASVSMAQTKQRASNSASSRQSGAFDHDQIGGTLPRTTSTLFADSTAFALVKKDLAAGMQDVYFAITSLVSQQSEKSSTSRKSAASLAKNPSAGLVELYQVVAGKQDISKEFKDHIQQSATKEELVLAVLGASIWKDILSDTGNRKLTFGDFTLRQHAALGDVLSALDTQLQPFHTNLDTIHRRAYLAWLRQPSTRETEVGNVADMLKYRFAGWLLEHMRVGRGQIDDLTVRWARALRESIKDLLLLNAEVSCAREKYSFHWPASGAVFDGVSMEGTHGVGEKVVVTIFPGFMMERKDGSQEVIARACVKAI